jgi:AmmeMemoRadiSam system protein A
LNRDEQRSLLGLARASIQQTIRRDQTLEALVEQTQLTPGLCETRGAFVSLKQPPKKGQRKESLRGCIGCIVSREALHRTVIDLASKAAFHDPRFSPLVADELSTVRIEISVLTPMRPLGNADDLVVGRDGVHLSKGAASAVFLPQVAPEHGWTADVLLRQLALKAGLPQDAWREADLEVFTAEVFREHENMGTDLFL